MRREEKRREVENVWEKKRVARSTQNDMNTEKMDTRDTRRQRPTTAAQNEWAIKMAAKREWKTWESWAQGAVFVVLALPFGRDTPKLGDTGDARYTHEHTRRQRPGAAVVCVWVCVVRAKAHACQPERDSNGHWLCSWESERAQATGRSECRKWTDDDRKEPTEASTRCECKRRSRGKRN